MTLHGLIQHHSNDRSQMQKESWCRRLKKNGHVLRKQCGNGMKKYSIVALVREWSGRKVFLTVKGSWTHWHAWGRAGG